MTLLRAREGHQPSPNCLIPPPTMACGLGASTQGKEKEMNREVGQLGLELVDPHSKKKLCHLPRSSFWRETSPHTHLSPWEAPGWWNCSWKGAFRVHNLQAARWEGQSILKRGWPCSLFPSRSSRVQLLDDGAMKEEIFHVEMLSPKTSTSGFVQKILHHGIYNNIQQFSTAPKRIKTSRYTLLLSYRSKACRLGPSNRVRF